MNWKRRTRHEPNVLYESLLYVYAPLLVYAFPCDLANVRITRIIQFGGRRTPPAIFLSKRGFHCQAYFIKSLPVLSIVLALACDILLPDSSQHPAAEHPYFTWALLLGLAVYVIALLVSLVRPKVRDKLSYSALFYAGAVLVLNILNLLTAKFAILPVLSLSLARPRIQRHSWRTARFLMMPGVLRPPAPLRLARRCDRRHADRNIAIGSTRTFACKLRPFVRVLSPDPVHRMDSAGAHRLPDGCFRQCLPHCAVSAMVPDHRAHQQRRCFHPQLVLKSPRRSAQAALPYRQGQHSGGYAAHAISSACSTAPARRSSHS